MNPVCRHWEVLAWPGLAFPSGDSRGWGGVCSDTWAGGGLTWAGIPSGTAGSEGTGRPGGGGTRGEGRGGQGSPWSRYWSRCRSKGMPTVRSSSSLSSRTVMSLRHFVTWNISLVSSSSTRMTKVSGEASGVKSRTRLPASWAPTLLAPGAWPGGCAGRGHRPAKPAPRPPRR